MIKPQLLEVKRLIYFTRRALHQQMLLKMETIVDLLTK